MERIVEFRGAFEFTDASGLTPLWENLQKQIPESLYNRIRKGNLSPRLIIFWESGLANETIADALQQFAGGLAQLACAGFACLRRQPMEPEWFYPSGKMEYLRPAPGAAPGPKEDLLPLDPWSIHHFDSHWKGADDKLRFYYEKFEINGEEIFCIRPDGGKLVPDWFIHWGNYHFIRRGKRLYLEVEDSQIAPDDATLSKAEYILDLSGEALEPLAYIHEEEGFFQVHTPLDWCAVSTPAGEFRKTLRVRVDFYWVGEGEDASREKFFWYFAPGTGLVKMEGEQGEILLKEIKKEKKGFRLFS